MKRFLEMAFCLLLLSGQVVAKGKWFPFKPKTLKSCPTTLITSPNWTKMGKLITLNLLGFSVISPIKEMKPNRLERMRVIHQVYSERTQDSLNVRLVGRWPYGTNYAVAVSKGYAYLGCGGVVFVLDIQDIKNPKKVTEITTPGVVRGLFISGDYLYIADGDEGLRIIDISNPSSPKEVSYYDRYPQGTAERTFVLGNYVYLAKGLEGLFIIDISDPTKPKKISRLETHSWLTDVYVSGDHAYLANNIYGLWIVDISNPSNPEVVNSCECGGAHSVFVSDSYAYVGTWERFSIIDISNPLSPKEVGSYQADIWDEFILGSYAYLVGKEGLKIIDISDPSNTQEIGSYGTSGISWGIFLSDTFAFIANGNGLYIVDVSEPSNPKAQSIYNTPGEVYSACALNHYLYGGCSDGLRVMDISVPSQLREIGFLKGGITSLWPDSTYIYTACGDSGMWVIDISDPFNPRRIGECKTPGFAGDLCIFGSYAYVASGTAGLRVIDISNPIEPKEVGFCDISGYFWNVGVSKNYAYIGGLDLRVIDVSDPFVPKEVSSYTEEGNIFDLSITEPYLYAQASDGLLILDLSNPKHPQKIGNTHNQLLGGGVYSSGTLLYVVSGFSVGGLLVIDISDPYNLKVIGSHSAPSINARRIWVSGDYIYVADPDAGLFVFQYSEPRGKEEKPNPLHPSLTVSPNPAKGSLCISYNLPKRDDITISLYDATGRLVKILESSREETGAHNKVFGIDDLKPGVYFIKFEGESFGKRMEKVIII